MDNNKEKIINALSQVPEEYLVSAEEIAEVLKIVNNIKGESCGHSEKENGLG